MNWPSLPPFRRVLRLSLFVLALFLLACLAVMWAGLSDDLHPADLGVVLGSKVFRDGQPSPPLQARLNQAAKLYREGYIKIILVSGAHGREGYDEPVVMRRYLEGLGIPTAVIFEDNQGSDTWRTARDTARFLAEHHLQGVVIVSQYFHMPRCRLAFNRFGIGPIYTSHAPYWAWRDFYSVPREVVGLIGYTFRPSATAS